MTPRPAEIIVPVCSVNGDAAIEVTDPGDAGKIVGVVSGAIPGGHVAGGAFAVDAVFAERGAEIFARPKLAA